MFANQNENQNGFPKLDSTTPWYEFNSYIECCNSLGVKPFVTKFIRYNEYYKNYGNQSS